MNRDNTSARITPTCAGRALGAVLFLVLAAWPQAALADRAAAEDAVRAGNTAYFAADYAAAETHFSTAIAADGTWAVPYNNRGLARLRQANFAGAESDFEAAKQRDAAYVAPYLNKGKCLAAQRKFPEAETELQVGLAKEPNNAKLLYNLGWVYDEQNRALEAVSRFDAALAADASYHRARVAKGVTQAKNNLVTDATASFYGAINAVPAGDLTASVAAYDLQVLRSGGIDFHSDQAAQDFRDGVFALSAGLDALAANELASARAAEGDVAEIPWLQSWCALRRQDGDAAGAALADAQALMPRLEVRSWHTSDVFVDGIKRGTTPTAASLFRSRFDLTLRNQEGSTRRERSMVVYGDRSFPSGHRAVLALPAGVSSFSSFAGLTDSDTDWLSDAWETSALSGLAATPTADGDADGLSNLRESWTGTDPTKADSDSDGTSDGVELKVASDPRGAGSLSPLVLTSQPNTYLIASAGHVGGLNNTSWLSDAVLHNPGSADARVTLFFLKKEQDNSDTPSFNVTVPGGRSVKLLDVVEDTLHETGTSGAILVASDTALQVTSRTFNNAASGTYGQYIEGYPLASAVVTDEEVRLIQLTKSADYRTNIGFANPTGKRVTVRVDLFRADRSAIGGRSITLEPFGYFQETDLIAQFGASAADAYAVVSSTTPDARFFTYASVIDGRTGDPVQVVPVGRVTGIGSGAGTAAAAAGLPEEAWGPPHYSPDGPGEHRVPSATPGTIGATGLPPASALDTTVLTSGVPVTGQVAQGGWNHYRIEVPANATELLIATTDATGDADIYVRFGAPPDSTNYDYRPYSSSGNETVTVTPTSSPQPLAAGSWYIGISGYAAASYTLTATVTVAGPCTVSCAATVPASALVAGATVFHATVTNPNCLGGIAYDWDFGDGSTHGSTQNPTHAYGSPGSYTWRLTASSGGQSCSTSGTIAVTAVAVYVPAAAHVIGAVGTDWRTDLEVHNPGTTQAAFVLALLKRDQANPNPDTRNLTLEGGRSIRYEDVTLSVFNFTGAATLRVTPTAGRVMVTSRTYNRVPIGTFGQFIPGRPETEAIEAGESVRLTQLSQSTATTSGFRTNLGLVNVGATPITVAVELYRGDGTHLGSRSYNLGAYEFRQIDRIIAGVTTQDVDDAFAVLSTATAGGRFFAYASVIDNRSGDPIYVPRGGAGH
ncbi:MAG: pre-peptidase C-terminal domain-containing protein [Acidobacteria bacterium]|nr:pre-peptidase C-terminal domain-containing protein [Acidobacteriota bacterium]